MPSPKNASSRHSTNPSIESEAVLLCREQERSKLAIVREQEQTKRMQTRCRYGFLAVALAVGTIVGVYPSAPGIVRQYLGSLVPLASASRTEPPDGQDKQPP